MLKSKYNWEMVEAKDFEPQSPDIHPKVERLLFSRGLGDLGVDAWHAPFLFQHMTDAVGRIKEAINNNQKILIYGDYDADGVTSTVLLLKAIRSLGGRGDYYIPNRFFEGYGPNTDAFMNAIGEGYELVITVDCGISGIEEATVLKQHDVDLIITDHHLAKEILPDAFAIIHPEIDVAYPFDDLAGVGVVLKLVEALKGELTDDDYMLATFGTIADVVPLLGENRTIVKRGLVAAQKTEMPALQAMYAKLELNPFEVDEQKVGFLIGPRLNASGRMDDANLVIDFLLTESVEDAMVLVNEIEALNTERKAVTEAILKEAIVLGEAKHLDELKIVVLYGETWHEGVLGIVASRLVDKWQKAVIVLTANEDGLAKGSGRAPDGYDLYEMLDACKDYLLSFGGHARAAGLSLEPDQITDFEIALNQVAKDVVHEATLQVDLESRISEIDLDFVRQIEILAPFGEGNRKPLVKLESVTVSDLRRIGAERQHLKFMLADDENQIDALLFNGLPNYIYLEAGGTFDVVCELITNEWNGNINVQAKVVDLACNHVQLLDLRRTYLEADFSSYVKDAWTPDQNFESKAEFKEMFLASGKSNIALKSQVAPLMPDRSQLGFAYQTMKKHAPFLIDEQVQAFFQKAGLDKETLIFILRVFTETGLITYENGKVSLNETEGKVDFSESKTYAKQVARVKTHEFFEFATQAEILDFLEKEE